MICALVSALLFLLTLHLGARYLGLALYTTAERIGAEDKAWTKNYASYYFTMTKPDSVDTVFIGSSHQFCSIDVNILNREYGENSILLASAGQDMELSYFAAMAAVELQHPKAIVLETLGATWNEAPTDYRRAQLLDNLPNWSRAKYQAVRTLGGEPYLRYYPITSLHSKWFLVRRDDLRLPERLKDGERLRFLYTKITPLEPWEPIPAERTAPMAEDTAEWLERIVRLCEENGVRLILYTAPYSAPEREQEIFNGLNEFAREHGLLYRNMMYDMDAIGLDPARDYMDSGHLNSSGQEKLTRFLAETLLTA